MTINNDPVSHIDPSKDSGSLCSDRPDTTVPSAALPITRCVCTDITFTDLKTIALRDKLTLHQLADRTNCTRNCGLCKPYLQRMYRTGQTRFPITLL